MHSAAEQTQYWMWSRRKFGGRPYIPSLTGTGIAAYNESWEERAFADDSSGRLGGCVWPPRSYSCSFCRREFRSAQALGGHMNVHRRDRARLKQSPPANLQENNTHLHPQPYHLHPNLCSPIMMCSPNPNHGVVASASPLSPTRVVSVASTQENCIENTTLVSPSYFSSTNQGQQQRKTSFLHTHDVPAELKLGGQNLKIGDVYGEKRKEKCEERKDNIFSNSCKKQRTDAAPSFLGQDLNGGLHCLQSKVLVLDHVSVEELDLELRLGDRPKSN